MLGMEVWRHEMAISKGGPRVPGDAKPFQHLPWPDSQSQQLGTAEIQRGKGTAQPWDQEGQTPLYRTLLQPQYGP